jgi:hypothetical protein
MPSWISAVMPLAVLIPTVAVQFYFKWFPDVADQKRHVRIVFVALGNLLSFGLPLTFLIRFATSNAPVTPATVIEVVIDAMCLTFSGVLVLIGLFAGKLIRRMIDSLMFQSRVLRSNVDNTERILKIVEEYREALVCIGKDLRLSPATRTEIDRILAGASTEAKPPRPRD